METRTALILGIAGGLVLLAVLAMAGAHEKHYRDRRSRIAAGRMQGYEIRLANIEEILTEDRMT